MKFKSLHKVLSLVAFFALSLSAYASEVTYDFTSSIPAGWTASAKPNGFETTGTSRGTQFTTRATLTLAGVKNVTKVVVTCSSNIDSGNSLGVSVGGTLWGNEDLKKEVDVEKIFTGASASGDLVLSITRTSKSVYIKKVVVYGDIEGGNDDDDKKEDDGGNDSQLDPNYTYSEPTVVVCSGALGSNSSYQFVSNNILVSASTGAQTETYFSCNAGNTISFTATKNIKAVVVNGYVKQSFSATASSGVISYVDAVNDAVEADPVLIVKDVDSKTLTITCNKQLRCYNVNFYFEENPDVKIDGDSDNDDVDDGEGDDEEGDFTYEYESSLVTKLDITFDELNYVDYTEYMGYNLTDLYFVSDDYEMEMYVFAPSVSGTCVEPGTYEINSTYQEGTVQASPGGDDYYDYPTYLATDFEYDSESDAWYYNSSYYLVSGTLKVEKDPAGVKMTIDAKTYYGSTVHATFVGKAKTEDEDAIYDVSLKSENTSVSKFMQNGKLLIKKDGKIFNAQGIEIK